MIQPAPRKMVTRARQMSIKTSRSQNYFKDSYISFTFSPAWVDMSHPAPAVPSRKSSNKRQMVQLTIWLQPAVKAEIQRIAEKEGLSISQTGRAGLE